MDEYGQKKMVQRGGNNCREDYDRRLRNILADPPPDIPDYLRHDVADPNSLLARLVLYKAYLDLELPELSDEILPYSGIDPTDPTGSRWIRLVTSRVGEVLATPFIRGVVRTHEADWQRLRDECVIRCQLNAHELARVRAHLSSALAVTNDAEQAERLLFDDIALIRGVAELAQLLAAEPIEVATGVQEEPQRTWADMQNELSGTLVSLDQYTAYCALLGEDRKVQQAQVMTIEPEKGTEDESGAAAISARSQRLYYQQWSEVFQEVKERQQRPGRPEAPVPSAPAQSTAQDSGLDLPRRRIGRDT